MMNIVVVRWASRLLVLLTVVGVLHGALAKDMWHRPGSHKVGTYADAQ